MLVNARSFETADGGHVNPVETLQECYDVIECPVLSGVNVVNIVRARAMQLRDGPVDPAISQEAAALVDELTEIHGRNIDAVSALMKLPLEPIKRRGRR